MRFVAPTLVHSLKVDIVPTFARLRGTRWAEPMAKLVIPPFLEARDKTRHPEAPFLGAKDLQLSWLPQRKNEMQILRPNCGL
jgi:hypothetical protein